jgi:hypothetical protein
MLGMRRGIAGCSFLAEARALVKAKRPATWRGAAAVARKRSTRVNAATARAPAFPLLSCGVIAGFFWTQGETGELWIGGAHAIWSTFAWAVYGALVVARFRRGLARPRGGGVGGDRLRLPALRDGGVGAIA